MDQRLIVAAAAAIGATLLLGRPLDAQISGSLAPPRAAIGTTYESYSFQDPVVANIESISLLTTSVAASAPLRGAVAVGLAGRYARGSMLRGDGSESTVDGLTDAELSVTVPVRRGNVVTTFGGLLLVPIGSARMSVEEADLAGIIASELLPFRMTHWGTGGGAGGSLGAAYVGAAGSVGVTAGYLVSRRFAPVEGSPFTYQAGNRAQIRLAADRRVGPAGKLALNLVFLHSDADLGDDTNLFQPGNRYQGLGSYSFAFGRRGSAILYLGGEHRRESQALRDITRGMPAQDLILAGGGIRLPVGGSVLLPNVDARVFRRASAEDQGYVTGVGLALESTVGQIMFVPGARVRFGRLVADQSTDTPVSGFEVGLTLRSARRGGV
jgi:hypothetical protein